MDVRRKFANGAFWSIVGKAANNIVSFIVFAIISRSVAAELIGIVAFALVFIEFGRLFVHAGVPDLIVRQAKWDDDYASMCFWLNTGMGVVAAAAVMFVAAPLSEAHFAAGSGIVLIVLSVCFVIESLRMVSEARLQRDMDYKKIAQRGIAANFLAGVVGIAMALTGWGIWALVAQRLVSSILTTAFTLIVSPWWPKLPASLNGFGGILGHGSGLMGASMLKFSAERLPDLVLGIVLGPVPVAIYRVGARGYEAVSQLILLPIGSAAFAGFARMANSGKIGPPFLRTLGIFAILAYPILFGAGAVSTEFVDLAFGDRWDDSADIMMVLALGGAPAVLSILVHSGLSAVRQTATILRVQAIAAASVAAVLILTVSYGPLAMAMGLTAHAYACVALYTYVGAAMFQIPWSSIVKAVAPPFLASLVMFGAIHIIKATLLSGQPDWLSLPILIGIGALIYLVVVFVVFGRYLHAMLNGISDVVPALMPLEIFLHRLSAPGSR